MKIEIDRTVVQHAIEALEAGPHASILMNTGGIAQSLRTVLAAPQPAQQEPAITPSVRSVMQQALEALMGIDRADDYKDFLTLDELESISSAMLALREALAAPANQLDDINVADMAAPNSVEIDGIKTVAQQATLVKCTYGDGGLACCEGGPCRAEEQNNAALADPVVEPVASTAKGAIMGAAYDFRDAHISESSNLKRSAHAALEAAVDAALNLAPQQAPDALHLAAMDLARKQAQRIAELEQQLAAREPLTDEQKHARWVGATIEQCTHENCYYRGIADAETHHGITKDPA